MRTKNVLTTTALVSTLLLTACATNEEYNKEPEESETVEASGKEEDVSKSDDKDGEVVGEEETYIPAGYEGFHETFATFELPEEGRLSEAEAIELVGQEQYRSSSIIAYENGMVFDENSKRLKMQVHRDGERPYPHGAQSLGFFMTIVETSISDIQVSSEGSGTEAKPLEEFTTKERDSFEKGHGIQLVQQKNMYLIKQLRQFETYFSESGYDELAEWTTETVELMEHADTLSQSDWEEIYTSYYQAVQRIVKMGKSFPDTGQNEE